MTDRWDEEELKRAKEIARQIEQEFAPALHGGEADLGAVVGIIAAARRAAHAEGIERAAKVVEEHAIVSTADGAFLRKRRIQGDVAGMEYATGIRSLIPTPASTEENG